ncbi:uncharacterized protein LOC115432053 [Sphaeramia orbicularis]|uniref:uncharacterized protein LOC115432053 n=1 Tax=Sphaeramia orbicularis TaxID=375764 RepID=UPI00117C5970|nr:uncharacterized protein LOC115432053 [Sphaeramia orbicularis]
MMLKVVLFALSFLTTSAFPLQRMTREANWADSKANQAHDKIPLTKDMDNIYKSQIDSNGLYTQEDGTSKNPVAEEVQHKLIMESERLRTRLRQELAELQEKLSPSPGHLSSTLASMRERLAPLTQQLQSSLSSSTHDLCGQVNLYLQDLETAEAQAQDSPALYQETLQRMSQTLEHSSSKLANLISNFQTQTFEVIEHLKEISTSEGETASPGFWQEVSSRLRQEVTSLRADVLNGVGILKEELSSLQISAQPIRAKVTASMEQLCQNAALQSQVFQAQMERVFVELEKDLAVQGSSSFSSSSALQPGSSLQGDFSDRLSALIQDILHSVQ